MSKTIREWQNAAHALSVAKGWYEHVDLPLSPEKAPLEVVAKLCLIHSEVSEALEAVRDIGKPGCSELSYLVGPKPEGLGPELADVAIRLFDLCGAIGLDLEAEIERKHAYNVTRSHRHGGRAL